MWGGNDPSCRKAMVWEELEYAGARHLPNGERRVRPETVQFDHELFEHYHKLIRVRNTHPALQLGDYHTLLADDQRDLLAFSRACENQNIVVVINNSGTNQRTIVPVRHDSFFEDLLDEGHRFSSNGEQLEVEVEAKSGRILIQRG